MDSRAKKRTVKIAGLGGQGVILASVILGHAAILDGKYATQTASYGSEARGGECKSEVIISDNVIDYPLVDKVQTLLVMSRPAFIKYIVDLESDGILFVDPDMMPRTSAPRAIKVVKIPATRTADKLGSKIVANIVMLGALQCVTNIVSERALHEAIKVHVPAKTLDLNIRAALEGKKLSSRSDFGR